MNYHIDEIYVYDSKFMLEGLGIYCNKAEFVFNLAGMNRLEPQRIL